MRFESDFEKREWLGREALKQVKQFYPNLFKYELNFTTGKYDDYDAFYFIIDTDTQKIKKRVWIEIKIRDTEYDEYILEKKKLKQLIKKKDDLHLSKGEYIFLYVNFTPKETIIWNITNINPNNTKTLKANKETSVSRNYKINKEIIYLKPEEGLRLQYILNEKHLLSNYDDYLLKKVKEKIKTKKGLEEILFN